MRYTQYIFLFCLTAILMMSCDKATHDVVLETEFGEIQILLYDETPKHKENFIKLVKEGFYDDLLFHRVMDNFMIQGGDPDSKDAAPGTRLGNGGPGYQIDHEIGFPHFKGALAAARTPNPQKRSSGSQFYIVEGNPVTDQALNSQETRKGFKYSEAQREIYKSLGGRPDLDGEYTVFGEVVMGMDVVDKITEQQTDANNRPIEDIRMRMKMR